MTDYFTLLTETIAKTELATVWPSDIAVSSTSDYLFVTGDFNENLIRPSFKYMCSNYKIIIFIK